MTKESNGNMWAPHDLWAGDGHVTDLVVDLIADGQEQLLPSQLVHHVAECEVCSSRVGRALAALSLVDEAFATMSSAELAQVRDRRFGRFPWVGALAASLVAMAGTLPGISQSLSGIVGWWESVMHWGPKLLKVSAMLLTEGSTAVGAGGVLVMFGSTFTLAFAAWLLARSLRKHLPKEAVGGRAES